MGRVGFDVSRIRTNHSVLDHHQRWDTGQYTGAWDNLHRTGRRGIGNATVSQSCQLPRGAVGCECATTCLALLPLLCDVEAHWPAGFGILNVVFVWHLPHGNGLTGDDHGDDVGPESHIWGREGCMRFPHLTGDCRELDTNEVAYCLRKDDALTPAMWPWLTGIHSRAWKFCSAPTFILHVSTRVHTSLHTHDANPQAGGFR